MPYSDEANDPFPNQIKHPENGSQAMSLNLWFALLLVVIFLFLQIVFGVIFGVVSVFMNMDVTNDAALGKAVIAAVIPSQLLVLLFVFKDTLRPGRAATLGVKPFISFSPEARKLVFILLGALLLFDLAYQYAFGLDLQTYISEPLQALATAHPFSFVAFVLAITVGAPLVEELLFRGYLQTALSQRVSPWVAILISTSIFTLIHFDVEAAPPIFAAGLCLGYVFHKTQSLWPAIVLHAGMNAFGVGYMLFFG